MTWIVHTQMFLNVLNEKLGSDSTEHEPVLLVKWKPGTVLWNKTAVEKLSYMQTICSRDERESVSFQMINPCCWNEPGFN